MKTVIAIVVVAMALVGLALLWVGCRGREAAKETPQERPADWNKTVGDLMDELKEGKRATVEQPEIGWAREYEKSLIPEGTRYPKKGDVYESNADQTIRYMTAWAAPYTGGGEAVLQKGERIWIDNDPIEEDCIGTYALPIDYDELEARMVPAEDRQQERYGGFYLSVDTVDLNRNFTLVQTGYEGPGKPPTADDDSAESPEE